MSADDGAVAYTSYWVAGYTVPRISTDAVRIWDTTGAVVTVGGGAAVSAASCCGDFTNEAPISPPTASRAAAIPTPISTRRRRASRDPRIACPRPLSSGPLCVAMEPSCVTRVLRYFACRPGARGRAGTEAGTRLNPGLGLTFYGGSQEAARSACEFRVNQDPRAAKRRSHET